MPRYIDTEIKNSPFRVLAKTKQMLNEVDTVHETPSKHLFDFSEDSNPAWEDPDEIDQMILSELGESL